MNMLFIMAIMPCLFYYLIKGNKVLHMFQQNWYNEGNRYLRWLISGKYMNLINPDMFFVIFITTMFFDNMAFGCTLFAGFYLALTYFFVKQKQREQVKKPLAFTARVRRLIVTELLIFLIPVVIFSITVNEYNFPIYFLILGAYPYLLYYLILVINLINKPIEKMVYHHFLSSAKNKLKEMSALNTVGITGSYGKTSSKNILNDILSTKFNVCPTPKNFNTPNGLMITINNHLDKFTDVFIAEMGAFRMGEIKELCDFVHPKFGILTKVGTAHMETFGSQKNIQSGKFELIENLPADGVGILNRDDELQVSYKVKNSCKLIWVGIDNKDADLNAINIKQSATGMSFDVKFKNGEVHNFETKLLGTPNIYNILQALALGEHLGIPYDQLKIGVRRVKATEHRLELKRLGDINIIDDAYNSNPVGAKMALDVLSLMKGVKIVVTPGMIELGTEQYKLNKAFGEQIADVATYAILVGEAQTKPIYDGLIAKGFKEKNIFIINDVKVAFKLMHQLKGKETYVLLENDLPDIFNEK